MIVNELDRGSLLNLFQDGDVDSAICLLQDRPELAAYGDYKAHPLIRQFVARKHGHCHRRKRCAITDLLIPERVRFFRDAVVDDKISDVWKQLCADRV